MNIPTKPSTLREYERQNQEIIKSNTKLNERIAMLEILVSQLQQENLQLRIDKAKKPKRRKKAIPKKRAFNAITPSQPSLPLQPLPKPSQQENIPTDNNNNNNSNNNNNKDSKEQLVNDLIITTHSKRSCSNKPISYVLPSAKCKLRKGDPFTFGNE